MTDWSAGQRRPYVVAGIAVAMLWAATAGAAARDEGQPSQANGWVTLSAGNDHTCGIRTGYSLWCWGNNYHGEVGDGTTTDRSTPTQVGVTAHWLMVVAGDEDTCALQLDDTLWCWGSNDFGQLGLGDVAQRDTPTQVGSSRWFEVAVGGNHTCGRDTTFTTYCWGQNSSGQVGDGTTVDRLVPTQVGRTYGGARALALGSAFSCEIMPKEYLTCWGENNAGQLGTGDLDDRLLPTVAGSRKSNWASVTAGGSHVCGVRFYGPAYCWGDNAFGQVGDGTNQARLRPSLVPSAVPWRQLSAGYLHTCGLKVNGSLRCWGYNALGQLGDSSITTRLSPVRVWGGASWSGFSSGASHTCGYRPDASGWCWGSNAWGGIGDGTQINRYRPTAITMNEDVT